ncbi:MAG: hypothetical protein NXI22_18390 [bacterium]|nr:hypothetical protein [bacterium]
MSMVIGCPHCNGQMSLSPDQGGKQVACPHCQKMFTAPGGAPVARATATPVARPPVKPAVPPTARPVVPTASPRPPQTAQPGVGAAPPTDEAPDERLERFRSRTKSSPIMTIVYIVGGIFVAMVLICGIGGYVIFQSATAPIRELYAEQEAEREIATNMVKQVLAQNGRQGKLSNIVVFADQNERVVTGNVASSPFQCTFKVRTNNNRSVWDILEASVDGQVVYTKPPAQAIN